MSNKEKIIQLLDDIPDYKMGYILAYVQGITADEKVDDIETVIPDEWDLQMLSDIKKEPGCQEFISSEDVMKELGL